MKYLKQKLLVLLIFLCLIPVFSQEYPTGAIPNPERYGQINTKPVLHSRNFSSIPRSFSLRQYSPIPEDQSPFGTCTAWASVFAARTITESIAKNRIVRQQSSDDAFSPYYVYINVSKTVPPFTEGIYIGDALDFLKETGAVKRLQIEKLINWINLDRQVYSNREHFPISDYVTLYGYKNGPDTIENRVLPVKKSISEKKPVIIAMEIKNSFNYAKDMWQNDTSGYYGYHAMCVIGYDDDKYGGAFLIQNSWGTNWGNEGLVWIKYDDFATYVYEAYEIKEDLIKLENATQYAASIEIEVENDNRGMPVLFDQQGFYKTRSSYPTGTRFRFLMTNRYPAYVYAFSTDSNNSSIERIFPSAGISPIIDYPGSTIAWPSEYETMEIFGEAGTDYLAVLYSKVALDIAAIEQRFANATGTFPERVARAVGANLIPYNNVRYTADRIEFSATSINPNAVFSLLLAVSHN
jgi:hypothetical protein